MTNGVDLEMVQRQEGERPSGKGIASPSRIQATKRQYSRGVRKGCVGEALDAESGSTAPKEKLGRPILFH